MIAARAQQHLRHRQARQLGIRQPFRLARPALARNEHVIVDLHVQCDQAGIQVWGHNRPWMPSPHLWVNPTRRTRRNQESLIQVAIAWTRSRSPAIIPIIGARRLDQLLDNLGAASPRTARRRDHTSRLHDLGGPWIPLDLHPRQHPVGLRRGSTSGSQARHVLPLKGRSGHPRNPISRRPGPSSPVDSAGSS
jgi:hypothetical protein